MSPSAARRALAGVGSARRSARPRTPSASVPTARTGRPDGCGRPFGVGKARFTHLAAESEPVEGTRRFHERQAGRDQDPGPANSSLDLRRRAGLEDGAEDGRGVKVESCRHYGEPRSARTSPRRRCAVPDGRPSPSTCHVQPAGGRLARVISAEAASASSSPSRSSGVPGREPATAVNIAYVTPQYVYAYAVDTSTGGAKTS